MKQVFVILTVVMVIASCETNNVEPSNQKAVNSLKKFEEKSYLNHDSTELELKKLDTLIKMLDQAPVNTFDTVKEFFNTDDNLKEMNYYLDSSDLDLKSIISPTSTPSQYH